MKCRLEPNSSDKHLYTVPWPFKQLCLSTLADDDTNSICPNVQYLTLDISSTSSYLSRRFPNFHTLNILHGRHLLHDDCLRFRRLRHLTMGNIDLVPSSIIRRIHTLKLFSTKGLTTHSMIYPNMKYFSLKNDLVNSFETVEILIQHFPNLRSLEVPLQLVQNAEYYNSLNILLDGVHLPHLLLLKINWINDKNYNSKVSQWISSKTSMKWRSTLFCAYHHDDDLIVCL